MSDNAAAMRRIQFKINLIVNDCPKLFRRLSMIMCDDAIWNLMYGCLWALYHLFGGDTCQIPPPDLSETVSDVVLQHRRELLEKLESEVIRIFEKIQGTLNWNLVVDLCAGGGWYLIPREGESERLNIIDIYCDHVEVLHEDRLREERRREVEGSSSSDDSCNLEIW